MATLDDRDDDVTPVTIEDEMRRSYLDYAMSVIVSRALPDVRDGLKPVHRRILYAMKEGGYDSTRPYRKSARIVGDVMGQYHPHGDSAIYDAMVRMAQDFSMRLPLVDGQGNFGSLDGDPPAAMRYTEARLAKPAEKLLEDIDKDTVDFQPNYDESTREPVVLPARFPNLLVNGAGGIAVGMATNIPPHNLGEVIDATVAMIRDPGISTDRLITEHIPGPDFPTGAQILGRGGIRKAYNTGHGSVIVRARTSVEEVRRDVTAIVVHAIPYQQNKLKLIERIAEVGKAGVVEGISDVRDESDREGLRIVIELKRGVQHDVVLNQLYRATPLQSSFGCNMLALNHGRPEVLTLRAALEAFIRFREQVITRRTIFDLERARERAHILIGLAVAVTNIDDMIALIRNAPDPQTAREQMMTRAWPAADVRPLIEMIDEPINRMAEDGTYKLSEAQARAILDLRLHRLTGLERDKIGADLTAIVETISGLLAILASRETLLDLMVEELTAIKEAFATPRRTEILDAEFDQDIEDLIQREDMVVTISHQGYVKRVPLDTYRAQRRGGKGRAGMATKDEDFVSRLLVTSTHTPVLFFTSRGIAHRLKVYRLPLAGPVAKGKHFVNLLPLEGGETVSTVLALPEDEGSWGDYDILFATSAGTVRRNKLSDFANIRANGLIAMKLEEGERLIAVRLCQPEETVLLSTRLGKVIRFPVNEIRVFSGRTSTGVRGIRLADGDELINLSVLHADPSTAEERERYLRLASQLRRGGEDTEIEAGDVQSAIEAFGRELFDDMAEREQFVLTVSETGLGKRTSAYEYRVSGRGGQGIFNMSMTERVKALAACFPVTDADQIMLVTDGGQLIRMGIHDIRIAGRQTQGVTLFRLRGSERVVGVAKLSDMGNGSDPEASLDADDLAAEALDADPQPDLLSPPDEGEPDA